MKALASMALVGALAGGTATYYGEDVARLAGVVAPSRAELRLLDDGNPDTPPLPHSVALRVLGPTGSQPLTEWVLQLDIEGEANPCDKTPVPSTPGVVVNPTFVALADPYTAGRDCFAPLPIAGLPAGTGYRVEALFHADCPVQPATDPPTTSPCTSPVTLAFNTFAVQLADPCIDQVVLDLGDWTRTIPMGGSPRVQFSLLRSSRAIVSLRLSARMFVGPNGSSGAFTTTAFITGSDLKQIAGAYFSLPTTQGRHEVRVEASTAEGCTAGSDRPMLVEVTS